MNTEFAALYGYTARDVERIASCRNLLDAVVIYYLRPNACYIIYKRKKYKECDVARIAYDNKEMLRDLFGDSRVYERIEASIISYINDIV